MPHGIFSRRFRHGRTWYIRYGVGGRIVREEIGAERDGFTRAHAKTALQSRLGDVAQGKFRLPTVRKPVPVRVLIARYREHAEAHQRGYRKTRYTLTQLEAEFGAINIADLSPFRIDKWKLARRKVVAAATVNRELNVLKAMLAQAVTWKLLDVNPARDVRGFKVQNARLRYLELAELAALLAVAGCDVAASWLVPAIIIAVHTGLRQGELLRLKWTDLAPALQLATIPLTRCGRNPIVCSTRRGATSSRGSRWTDGDGARSAVLIDRMSLRINPTFSLLQMEWSPELTEESFVTTIDGVRNGPVRSIVRARQSLDLGRVLPDPPAGTMHTFYYASAFATPSIFKVPALALKLLRSFRFEGTSVLAAAGHDTRYFDAEHPQGIDVETPTPPADLERDHDWYVIDGPAGTYAQTLVIPESWRAWGVARGAVLRRDGSGRPAAGYTLRNMTGLRAGGAYDLLASIVVLDHRYRPGDEQSVVGMVHRRLEVEARPLAVGPAAAPAGVPPSCPSPSTKRATAWPAPRIAPRMAWPPIVTPQAASRTFTQASQARSWLLGGRAYRSLR